MRQLLLFVLTFGLCSVHAQDITPFLGKWSIGPQPKLLVRGSSFEITESGGTWKNYAAGPKSDGCAKASAPISIEEKTEKVMVFKVALSEVLNGCGDFKVKLVLGDDKQVTAFRNGMELQLKRE